MILPSFGLRPQTKNCEMTKDLNDNNRMKLLIEASALVVFVIISITSVLLVLKLTQKSDTEIGETVDSRNVAKDGVLGFRKEFVISEAQTQGPEHGTVKH